MPKLKPDIQRARREHILDAAEQCFARAGFHRTTMQDICRQAGVSPGALYVYFDSKEALIAGICERDRAEFAERLAAVAAAPDFLQALKELGEHYFVHESAHKNLLCIEIGVESTRNPRVGEIHRGVDEFIVSAFERLFQRMKDEGRIAPALEIPVLARVVSVIGDGLFWRRAVDPTFDARSLVPATLQALAGLLKPASQSEPTQ
jgi:AcrR family transcriptional regulator